MNWIWFAALIVAGVMIVASLVVWQRWVAPWRALEKLIGEIKREATPPTFLIEGGNAARRVALSLEDLFKQHQDLHRQLTERASGSETIFTAMQDGLMVVDANHRVTLVNRTLREWFGLPAESSAIPLLEVLRDADVDRLVVETLRTGQPQQCEIEVAGAPNGPGRHLQVSAVRIGRDSEENTGAVVLFHDITQLKQTDEIRRDFVANVSHELRTPLSILRGYIETLMEDPTATGEELARILDVMKKHSDRLNALVDDLLVLARLESAHPNIHIGQVRLSEVFAAIVRDWAKKFADKKLSVEVSVAPDVPIVAADPTRLQEVLYNLLDNAVKYSQPNGKIRLQASRHDSQVVISVSDTGGGIEEADLPRIFERFYRADKARSRDLGGTGLGLSIVKHIAQMHGGSVEAESNPGRGTTIRVLLPLPDQSEAAVTES